MESRVSRYTAMVFVMLAAGTCFAVELGDWHRIGPFRDQGPLINWMDNVASSFHYEFDVEQDVKANGHVPLLEKRYDAPNFPGLPNAVRQWARHSQWIDGYYQELPRGPAPSAGESQYLYRSMRVEGPTQIELDFIIRSPESDRRQNDKGMEYWRRTGRYKCWLNGKEIISWDRAPGDMPQAKKVTLAAGVNHFLAKVTNNRHAYGFAFSITGMHAPLRHEVGFERPWRPLVVDLKTEVPYHLENKKRESTPSETQRYQEGLKRLRALTFHPEPMPGVEHAALDSKGRIVPAMEKALETYPPSALGARHTARRARLEHIVTPLLEKIDSTGDPMTEAVFAAVDRLEAMWQGTIAELPKLVYLERPTYTYDSMMYEEAGTHDALIKTFDPATGMIETLVDFRSAEPKVKANEITLSWDAQTIYIGGGGWVSAVNRDGTGSRQIQRGQSPSELPDTRIVFFDVDSGQSPCKADGPRRLLFICDPDGGNRKLVSANTCIDSAPSVMNDGRIMFARWDYGVNKNVFNRHALWTQNPDGTGMDLFFGNTVIDPRSFSRPRQIPGRPEVLTVFGPHHAKLAGLLGLVWNGRGQETGDGIGFRRITHDTASVGDQPPVWAYQDPYPLNEQLFLVSFGGRPKHKTALYLYDRAGNRKCLLEAASERGIHSAQPFVSRKRPPVIPDRSVWPNWERDVDLHERLLADPDWTQKGTLTLQDVYVGLEPEIRRGQVKYLAVMEQVAQSHGRGGAIGVGTIWYVNRCIGLVPVEEDGSARFEVPALRSLYFHVLDQDGRMLMTQGSDFHVMPGEERGCIGCHEERKGITSPPNRKQASLALEKPLVHPERPDWGTHGIIEYETVVQPVFDKYCVKCHSGAQPKGRLNLSGDATTAYNMSYMQLTDGMYVHFTPGTGRTHAQPSNDYDVQAPLSRGTVLSRLTAHILDPEHCKQTISFADRLKVFLWIDSNVPFYSHYRQVPPMSLGAAARKALRGVYERRCAQCHDQWDRPDTQSGLTEHHIARHVGGQAGQWGIARSGMRVRHLNLSHPSHSATLQAPLAEDAGGWGLCQGKDGPIFGDKQDGDYQKTLLALQDGVVRKTGIQVQGVKELLKERQETQLSVLKNVHAR
jgi:hypothetical protein